MAKELGLNCFVCEQPPNDLLDRRIERELLPMARTCGFGIIPWSPLGGGLLTGKYQRDVPAAGDTRYGQTKANWLQTRMKPRMFGIVDRLRPLARAQQCTVSQLALVW